MVFATIFNRQIENDLRHDATLSRAHASAKNRARKQKSIPDRKARNG
jgi:hypothetical protein